MLSMIDFRKWGYFVFFPLFAAALYSLIKNYTGGDQVVYRALYDAFSSTPWDNVLSVSVFYVSGYEIVSPYILWLGAVFGVDKDLYITALNLFLIFVVFKFILNNKSSWFVIFLIVTNFYMIVLFTGAERLKISYIFLVLSALNYKNKSIMVFFALAAIASHMQSIILIVGIAIYYFAKEYGAGLLSFKLNRKLLFNFLFFISVFVFILLFFNEGLSVKGSAYSSDISERSYIVVLQALLLYFSVFFLLGRSFAFLLMSIYFVVCVVFLGGERVNMIYFTAVVFILIKEEYLVTVRKKNLLFLAVLMYLSYKSIGFVANIFIHGHGFYR